MKNSFDLWVVCVGGLLLLIVPFFNKWRLRWPKTALFIAGIMAQVYVVLGLVDQHIGRHDGWFSLLGTYQSMAGGIGIGLLVTFELFDLLDYRRNPACANPS
jgi:hypothetical protein